VKWILYLPSDCRVALYELISPSISQYNNHGQTTALGTSCPTVYDKRVDSFHPLPTILTLKMRETGPTVYSPYPRRLEILIICWCNYKGSTFCSVILSPAGVELTTSRVTTRCSTNLATGARSLDNAAIFVLNSQSLYHKQLFHEHGFNVTYKCWQPIS